VHMLQAGIHAESKEVEVHRGRTKSSFAIIAGACHRNNQKSKGVDNGSVIGHNIAVNILQYRSDDLNGNLVRAISQAQ